MTHFEIHWHIMNMLFLIRNQLIEDLHMQHGNPECYSPNLITWRTWLWKLNQPLIVSMPRRALPTWTSWYPAWCNQVSPGPCCQPIESPLKRSMDWPKLQKESVPDGFNALKMNYSGKTMTSLPFALLLQRIFGWIGRPGHSQRHKPWPLVSKRQRPFPRPTEIQCNRPAHPDHAIRCRGWIEAGMLPTLLDSWLCNPALNVLIIYTTCSSRPQGGRTQVSCQVPSSRTGVTHDDITEAKVMEHRSEQ